MSWIWEKSATWRRIVAVTKQSPLAMAGFTVVACAVPYYLGSLVMQGTNSEMRGGVHEQRAGEPQTPLEEKLRKRMTADHKLMARVNKERLAVLLGEVQRKEGGDERYAASLDGRSLGTHSRGTTTGARGIQLGSRGGNEKPPSLS